LVKRSRRFPCAPLFFSGCQTGLPPACAATPSRRFFSRSTVIPSKSSFIDPPLLAPLFFSSPILPEGETAPLPWNASLQEPPSSVPLRIQFSSVEKFLLLKRWDAAHTNSPLFLLSLQIPLSRNILPECFFCLFFQRKRMKMPQPPSPQTLPCPAFLLLVTAAGPNPGFPPGPNKNVCLPFPGPPLFARFLSPSYTLCPACLTKRLSSFKPFSLPGSPFAFLVVLPRLLPPRPDEIPPRVDFFFLGELFLFSLNFFYVIRDSYMFDLCCCGRLLPFNIRGSAMVTSAFLDVSQVVSQ